MHSNPDEKSSASVGKSGIVILAALICGLLAPSIFAQEPSTPSSMSILSSSKAIKWQAGPPTLKPGAQMAVLDGDPGKSGAPFTLRIKMPKGYDVAPHSHPSDLSVTVLTGTLGFGMGDKLDRTKGQLLKAGGFVKEVTGMHHYVWTTEPTVIQIQGMGPLVVNYVNPADDPSKAR